MPNSVAFCDSPFWDPQVIHDSNPDFTTCFQNSILKWLPSVYIYVLGPFWMLSSFRLAKEKATLGWLFIARLVALTVLLLLELTDLIIISVEATDTVYMVYILKSMLAILEYLYIYAILYMINRFYRKYSLYLLAYWIMVLIFSSVLLRSFILQNSDNKISSGRFVVFVLSYCLIVINLVLTAYSPKPPVDLREYPEENVSSTSKLTFFWITKLILKSFRNEIKRTDVWNLNEVNTCKYIAERFERNWSNYHHGDKKTKKTDKIEPKEQNGIELNRFGKDEDVNDITEGDERKRTNKKPRLGFFLFRMYSAEIAISMFLKLVETCVSISGPLILDGLIKFTQDTKQSSLIGYFLAISLFVCLLTQSFCLEHSNQMSFNICVKIRTTLMNLIYRKSLVLSSESRAKTQTGEVINYMQVNANTFADFYRYANYIWAGPLEIIFSLTILYFYIGNAMFVGLGVMAILGPLNSYFAHCFSRAQADKLVVSDSRIKILNEVLGGIKVIKFYGWELSFEKLINDLKEKELKLLKRFGIFYGMLNFSFGFTTYVVTILTFVTYLYTDENNKLDPTTTYVCLSLFNKIRVPLFLLGPSLSSMVQVKVAFDRISRYLALDEEVSSQETDPNDTENSIVFKKASFAWTKSESDIFFKNLDLKVPKGKLVAIVGKVGCGKSSLISSILGEMHKLSGSYYINGSVSYAAQQAWIQNATVKDNILFGNKPDEVLYRQVIEACALVTDLNILAAGDRTEIGEKGINLSGGQKQRISLARAVYNNSDIYLLDDPLSAVDAHVGKHIFDNVIGPEGMLKDKTRFFCTNSLGFLSECDEIIMLDEGEVIENGSYDELIENDKHFAKFIENYVQSSNQEEEQEAPKPQKDIKTTETEDQKAAQKNVESSVGEKIIGEEQSETGNIKASTAIEYVKACSFYVIGPFVLFYIGMFTSQAYAGIWLSDWSDSYLIPGKVVDKNTNILVYAMIGLAQHTCSIVAELLSVISILRSSRVLEGNMLKSIMRSTMQFFESTPIGRIINRFSKDMYSVEFVLPISFKDFSYCILDVLATVIVISIQTPLFATIIIPLFIIYFIIQRIYVVCCSKLKRLDSVSKSPVFSHLGETLSGISTIKAYKAEERFLETIQKRIDENNVYFYPISVLDRWLEIYLGITGTFLIFFATIFAIIARDNGTLTPGEAGLSITFALSASNMLNYMVKMTAQLESNLTSVERIKEYWTTPSEAAWIIPDKRPPKEWPQNGSIKFKQYSIRYRPELEPVLKAIDIEVKPGEKIGIVGRTGAGKSSMSLGLWRILETNEGSIEIDGYDIKDIGLHDLRHKLTIIPQDPVIFSGSLRMNLDPFEQYDDAQLWSALEKAHLKEFVQELDDKLMFECSEGGENLSVGQRQLLCLARALLRHTKILVLDEATAAIDHSTDELIQTTIREAFSDCTILTIAHRLNTILDSDRIMVLDKGRIIEFDSPDNLMSNPDGHFYSMAQSAGLINNS